MRRATVQERSCHRRDHRRANAAIRPAWRGRRRTARDVLRGTVGFGFGVAAAWRCGTPSVAGGGARPAADGGAAGTAAWRTPDSACAVTHTGVCAAGARVADGAARTGQPAQVARALARLDRCAPAATRPWTAQAVDWALDVAARGEREAAVGVLAGGRGSARRGGSAVPGPPAATSACSGALVSSMPDCPPLPAKLKPPSVFCWRREPGDRALGLAAPGGLQREDGERGGVDPTGEGAAAPRRLASSRDEVAGVGSPAAASARIVRARRAGVGCGACARCRAAAQRGGRRRRDGGRRLQPERGPARVQLGSTPARARRRSRRRRSARRAQVAPCGRRVGQRERGERAASAGQHGGDRDPAHVQARLEAAQRGDEAPARRPGRRRRCRSRARRRTGTPRPM